MTRKRTPRERQLRDLAAKGMRQGRNLGQLRRDELQSSLRNNALAAKLRGQQSQPFGKEKPANDH